jgi:hypothetical protein
VRFLETQGKRGVGLCLPLQPLDPTCPFETADSGRGQRAGQPVEGGKRGAVVQDRWDLDDYGKTQMASGHGGGVSAERSSDLSLYDLDIIR